MKNKQIIALIHLAMKLTFVQLLFIGLFFGTTYATPTKGQDIFDKKVSISVRNIELKKVLAQLENRAEVKFAYSSNTIGADKLISIVAKQELLSVVLTKILQPLGIKYKLIDGTILLYKDDVTGNAGTTDLLNDGLVQKNDTLPRRKVTGVVADQKGAPLANASVIIRGTQKGAITDAEGKFTLFVDDNENAILEVSDIGYTTSFLTVGKKTEVQISLTEVANAMNEVIVVGYQTQKRSDLTGALTTVKASEISKQPIGFADQALQGKASGVRITQSTGQPGEGVAIRIRGVGTINNNEPLFIIDGVPTKDGINFLNADDIASITVLKDAASAAIYGARSSNGVIVITTKTGSKNGKASFSYSGYAGIQTHGYLTPMVNAQEYKTLFNEAATNDNAISTNPVFNRDLIPDTLKTANTDWIGSIFRNAPMQSHELSVSGGNDKTQYAISGNIFNQDGIILNSWYKRYTLHTKINTQATDRLNIGINTNLSYYDKNIVGSSGDGLAGNGGSVVRYALFRDPAIPIYNADGSYTDIPQGSIKPQFFGDGYNPVALANNTDNTEKQFRVFGDVFAEYKILKNLKFKTDFGGDIFLNKDRTFNKTYGTNNRINSLNSLVESNVVSQNMLWNNTLQYNKVFNNVHTISILVGTEAVSNSTTFQSATDQGFPIQIPSLEFLGNGLAPIVGRPAETLNEWALFSLFGNINYNYKNLYYLTFSDRRDGSSRFGPANRYGNYMSGSAGWKISNAEWFKDKFSKISKLMLRASYGQLGNQDIRSNYPWASTISTGYNAVFGTSPASNQGFAPSSNGNVNVQWEASTQADAGLDIGIINDRLTFSADYFVKTTTQMLQAALLPMIGGNAAPPYVNVGSVRNSGLEFELNYRHDKGVVKYSFNANLATIQNKVLSLFDNVALPGGRIDNGVNATLTAVGHPIGSFYGYQMEGIFQTDAQIFTHAHQGNNIRPGDVMYKDQNGDGVIDSKDQTFLGSAIPKFTYGFTSNIEYKNFDLSIFFQGSYGNKIYMQVNQDIEGFYRPFNLTQRVYDERWHGAGTSNTMPLMSWTDKANNILEPSSRFIEDASYVRLKNLQIGYSIPRKALDKAHIKGLRFYLTAQNLFTVTKYTGLDPEMNTSNNTNVEKYPGDMAAGIDWGTYPSAKSYIIGVNLTF